MADYKIAIRAESPTGRVDHDCIVFSTSGDKENAANMMAEEYGGKLISDLFDLDFIIGKGLTPNEIIKVEDEKWQEYFDKSKITWEWEDTNGGV